MTSGSSAQSERRPVLLGKYTEIEFLDINLAKDSSLLLFTVPSTGGFERKPYPSLVLKSVKHEISSLFMNSICRLEK
jgi:hypothetical protein